MEIIEIIKEALANYGGDTKGIIQSVAVIKECSIVYVRLCNGNAFNIYTAPTITQPPVDIDSGEEISPEEWNEKFGKKYGVII